jgi:hypothetical protein
MGSVYINFMPEDEADRIEQCCCVSRDARHCASNMGDEHFAF